MAGKCAVFKLLPLAISLAYMCENEIPLYTATEIIHIKSPHPIFFIIIYLTAIGL
jgi:hypothetical protein